jgi:hypothetical protein
LISRGVSLAADVALTVVIIVLTYRNRLITVQTGVLAVEGFVAECLLSAHVAHVIQITVRA